MKLKNVRTTLASVNRVASQKTCEVVEVKTNYKRLDDGTFSKEEIDFFTLILAGNKFDTFSVKVPNTKANKIQQISDALAKEQDVTVEFQNLKLSLFAMVSNGTLYSGVSGRADDLTIVSTTTNPEDDVEIIL